MKRIAIFGDSWACGEWNTPDGSAQSYQQVHSGINEYLREWYEVQSFAKAGSSNWDILKRIVSYLEFTEAAPEKRADKIFVFQSSPNRPERAPEYDVDYDSLYIKHNNIIFLCDELLEIWYIKLQQVAEQFDTQFIMVGGLTDINTNILKLYPRLECMVPSWQQVLNPKHVISSVCLHAEPNTLELAHRVKNSELVKHIMDHSDSTIHGYLDAMDLDTMGPIDNHPSRKGHRIMADIMHNFLETQ
jgi:hypothetical protein